MSTTFATPHIGHHRLVGVGPRVMHVPDRAAAPAPTPATYRRRRIGAAVFAVALVVSVGSVAQRGLADRGGDPASVSAVGQHATYLVRSGDTLWSVAERFYPGADLPVVVDALLTLNGGASLQVGQRLNMP